MNTNILENFIYFQTLGRTLNSSVERKSYNRLKLSSIMSYDSRIQN
jgi:hypothetical protein